MFESFDIKIDKELGFFEYGGNLYAKKMTLNMKFKVSNSAYGVLNPTFSSKYLWLPYLFNHAVKGGSFYPPDGASFPFGLDQRNMGYGNLGEDGSGTYATNKKAKIYFGSFKNLNNDGVAFSFKPFDIDISKSYKYKNAKLESNPHAHGSILLTNTDSVVAFDRDINISFSVLNHSINEAIRNTFNVQRLFRLADSFHPSTADINFKNLVWEATTYTEPPAVYVFFNSLVNSLGAPNNVTPKDYKDVKKMGSAYVIKSMSIELDKDMGFFEYAGMLLIKKFNISIGLQAYATNLPIFEIQKHNVDNPTAQFNSYVNEGDYLSDNISNLEEIFDTEMSESEKEDYINKNLSHYPLNWKKIF